MIADYFFAVAGVVRGRRGRFVAPAVMFVAGRGLFRMGGFVVAGFGCSFGAAFAVVAAEATVVGVAARVGGFFWKLFTRVMLPSNRVCVWSRRSVIERTRVSDCPLPKL